MDSGNLGSLDDIAVEDILNSRQVQFAAEEYDKRQSDLIVPPTSRGKSMRKTIQSVFTVMLIGLTVGQVDAQQSPRSTSAERTARANWSPVRGTQKPTRQPSVNSLRVQPASDTVSREVAGSKVRQAGHEVVLGETIVEGPYIESMPMEGEVIVGPVHDSGCDSLNCAPACGTEVAYGGCDGIGRCSDRGCSMCGELASPNAWRPCITIGLPQDGWVSYEYLSWWQDGMYLPPLVTTSPAGTARANAGVLGRTGTSILFGGEDVLQDRFDGGRLRFGVWLDRCHTWGVAAELFRMSSATESFNGTSGGSPILARPFFNTSTGLNDSELVAFPNVVSGTVSATATSELRGAGFHFKRLRDCEEGCKSWLFCGCPDHFCTRTERLIGYRYLQLDESVRITEDLTSTDTANPGSFDIFDQFETRNQFNGIDLGWKYRVTRGYWVYSAMLRMAVGVTRQTVTIDGQTTINEPGAATQTLDGGLLALSSNIGRYKQNEFTIVPELDLELGYQLTDRIKLSAGYTFLYWSNVVRPGHQISLDVNPGLLPPAQNPLVGVQRPGFQFDTTDYWVQGVNAGIEYRW